MDPEPPSSLDDFEIAVVCALPLEFDAVRSLLDQVWGEGNGCAFGNPPQSLNNYRMGKVSAGAVAADLRRDHRRLRLALVVGICGGVPKAKNAEVLLGDVIVSDSLVQYDFGRQYPCGFRRKDGPQDNLAGPNREIRGMLAMLKTEDGANALSQKTASCLGGLQRQKPKYAFPSAASDRLFQPQYRHKHQVSPTCECRHHENESDAVCDTAMEMSCEELGCDDSFVVTRTRLEEQLAAATTIPSSSTTPDDSNTPTFEPAIHIGPVASGDTVMKSGAMRDSIAAKEGVIAFEMEAAGIWDHLPSLVVKGVCDYADSHKNKKWQDYAAAAAASVAKAILILYWHPLTRMTAPTDIKTGNIKTGNIKTGNYKRVLPFPPDPDLIDRPEILTWLMENSQLQGARVALIGLGGIGKSQIAIHFAHRVRDKSHIFWVNATTQSTLEESYRSIADRLCLQKPGDSPNDVFCRVGGWLGDEANGRWTMVFDNFDDSSILKEDDPRLLKALPQTSNGFTLVTSRTQTAAEKLIGSVRNIYPVPAMSDEVALELLQAKLKNGCGNDEGQDVVRLLDRMPLAISQAAAYINRRTPRVSVREYTKLFRVSDDKRKELLSWEYGDLRRYDGASNSILGTWTVTLNQIQQERPSAVDLLSLMSFFNPQFIPKWALKAWYNPALKRFKFTIRDILPSGLLSVIGPSRPYLYRCLDDDLNSRVWRIWMHSESAKVGKYPKKEKPTKRWKPRLQSMTKLVVKHWLSSKTVNSSRGSDTVETDEEFQQDLDTLLEYSLVTPTARKGALKMHPLVRYCTENWLSQSGTFSVWKQRSRLAMATNTLRCWKSGDQSRYGDLKVHLDHIEREVPEDVPTARLWTIITIRIVDDLQRRGSISPAAVLINKMIAVGDRVSGSEDMFTLFSLGVLARYLCKNGEKDKAEAVYRDMLQRMDRVDNSDSALQLRFKLMCPEILSALGRAEESEQIMRSIVEHRMRLYGERADITLRSLGDHAKALATMGRFEEACQIVMRLLREGRPNINPSRYDGAVTLSCLHVTTKMADHHRGEEVEGLLREIVKRVEQVPDTCRWFAFQVHGPFHTALAECLSGQGKVADAESIMDRGIEHMAKMLSLPSLRPPTLVKSLLECRTDREKAKRLLSHVVGNLGGGDTDDGKSDDQFYVELANIARHLYIQGRAEDGAELLGAISRHLELTHGKGHMLINILLRFQSRLDEWFLNRAKRREEGGGREIIQDEEGMISVT
ncbi:hypothetical protein C8A00DRAFT_17195 [Chaetomidium leptoderma]|uniref:NB-ARC domain-containing protein n=1 Tax=Chaetomidium leptoderma TaxID=669021 RepID=A0AAN6VH02_9PEZI|nr:hypothetical protein C8A00DRAFT_17195 [Chaetomidium leptoderma]